MRNRAGLQLILVFGVGILVGSFLATSLQTAKAEAGTGQAENIVAVSPWTEPDGTEVLLAISIEGTVYKSDGELRSWKKWSLVFPSETD